MWGGGGYSGGRTGPEGAGGGGGKGVLRVDVVAASERSVKGNSGDWGLYTHKGYVVCVWGPGGGEGGEGGSFHQEIRNKRQR